MLSTVVPLHSSPSWHSELHQLMPSSHHLLSACTNANLGPPFLPKSTTLIQQPSNFMNRLDTHSNDFKAQADIHCKSLAPLYGGQPVAMHDALNKIWIPATVVHILPKDNTRYTPVMVLFTATWDDTCMNAVSSPLTLFQTPQQPHCRLLPDAMSLCHNLHPLSLHSLCDLHLLHPQCLWLQSHRPQLFPPCQLSQRSPLHLCLWYPT